MKHTPNIYHLPWEIKADHIVNVKGVKVLEWLDNIVLSRAGHQDVDGRAFAMFIICAVNSHADLLEALEGLLDVSIARHPHPKVLRKQYDSGELERRLKSIGHAFSPDGFVQALLKTQAAIAKAKP